MEDKKDMLREQEAAKTASANSVVDITPKTEAEDDEEEESLVIKLKKPYKFEGKEYTEIDLSGLEDLSAADMISVNKYLDRQLHLPHHQIFFPY